MRSLRLLLPALFVMIALAPAATVDVQVERPAPDDSGSTQQETISIAFRAVDYRPALHAELEIELADENEPGPEPKTDEPPATPTPTPRASVRAPRPPVLPVRATAPARADIAAGRIALPPPANRV